VSLIKLFYQLKSSTKGSVIVFTALAMTVIVGFTALVVDVGMMYFTRGLLVKTADAAALAGVQEFVREQTSPENAAKDYLSKNGYDPDGATVNVSETNKTVEVELERTVIFSFARVLGFNESEVMARSKAVIGPLVDAKGVAPLSINEATYDEAKEHGGNYELKSIRWQNQDIGPGNYGALQLGETGANVYKNNIKDGYEGIIEEEEFIDTEPGNMEDPTIEGVNHLIDISKDCCDGGCYEGSKKPNCSLLIYIPVITTGDQGRTEVQVIGFAAFLIDPDNPPNEENGATITGKFIRSIGQGEINPDPEAKSYGVYGVKLIE